MDEFKVFHLIGDRFEHVADVDAADPQTAALKTQHGLFAKDWRDVDGVTATPGEHRSTTFGDIMLAPDGQEYKFAEVELGGFTYTGFQPTVEIREQHYGEWIDELEKQQEYDRSLDHSPDPPANPETERIISELEVGWLKAPQGWEYAETQPGERDTGGLAERDDSYEATLKQAADMAKYHNRDRGGPER